MLKISATEANRNFSKLLAKVQEGAVVEITIRGEVVAEMRPVEKADQDSEAEKQKSWEAFMERLRNQPALGVPRGSRDELYNDD
jgi:prevent-host-death family protein